MVLLLPKNRFLIWGGMRTCIPSRGFRGSGLTGLLGNGWVAGHLETILGKQGKDVVTTTVRMEDREAVLK